MKKLTILKEGLRWFLIISIGIWCLVGTIIAIDNHDQIKVIREGTILNAQANATFADVLLNEVNCKEVVKNGESGAK